MKKLFLKLLPFILVTVVAIAAVAIGIVYFDFISERIYEDSTDHLEEIYTQVNRSFGSFVERNWGLLQSFDSYLQLAEETDSSAKVSDFIDSKREYWGFSEFYFLSYDKTCMTSDGEERLIDTGDSWKKLSEDGERIMTGYTMPTGQEVTVFAMPSRGGVYNGFEYDAIAISYTNEDAVDSLNVDAFSGKSKCFVIHNDGTVLLSTQTGGSVFANYLIYLKAASNLDPKSLEKIEDDWKNGRSELLQCKIGNVSSCILYQPVGYQDYMLLSVVPQSVVSAGFLSVQATTINVLVTIFLLIGITVIVLIILRNNKQARKSRMELQYRERMFDVLSNSVDDIFIMLDAQNQSVDYISPNVERLLGIPVEEARENIIALEKCAINYNVVIPKTELEKIPLQGSMYRECEYMHQNTFERRWYRMTIYRMKLQEVEKYIVFMSDRTQEQQMNQKLQAALNAARSANEAKSNFLSNMSHDIRTPMNAIVGFSVLLEKDADMPEKVREYTRKIAASSHHMLSLINDVLDMSKIESGKTSLNLDIFSLPGLLEELNIILMPQAKAKNQDFKIMVQGVVHEQMIGDKLRLNQILLNLLSNAVKYTPQGGKIDFTVSEIPQSSPQFVKMRFTVRDNGIGMSEEFQQHIFTPFSREINSVTNKIQGTGLGMAITKNLVDLMGGIITLNSAPNVGSTFIVELTFTLPEQEEEESWYRHKITRMLVADDEAEICADIRELMRGTGIDVSCVTDGSSAVNMAVSAHNRGEDFNVILIDWKMPGQDGVETAKQIRQKVGKAVPILVLTSYDWSDIEAEAREAGINAFMPKPFFVSKFFSTVKPLFEEGVEYTVTAAKTDEGIMKGMMFLVAEDNELNAEILTEMLKLEGADCELASNGLEAAEMFKKSDKGHFDMILMDVQMPVMNGYDATKAIRACDHPEAKTIPIAAMTANTFAEDVRDALNSGMNGHLAKPINMEAVKELVGKLTGGKSKNTED